MNLSVKEQHLYITYTAVFLSFTLKFERVCFTGDYSQWKKKSRTVTVIHLTEKTQTQNYYIWITLLPMPLIIFSLKLIKHEFLLELKAHTPGCVSESLGEAGGKPTPLGTAAVVRFI